ncbi:hypothetical protein [Actinocatenispora rupis]|uniref:DoxX protein n=1 Tax=Actinocatenispora rupis TaxID=519421 RepID=A0A8J3NAC2_9ACTN|nr:hypothetical protein [Actinocatenispora rupis]GID09560.1 hypothetical protein Aru02nite_04490 [Actinocatenispora rupis]
MRPPWRLAHWPARLATGAYILNSGLSKRKADEETTAGLHGMAAGAYPFLKDVPPDRFLRLLSAGEIAVGATLLLPVVPTALAGLALLGFGGGLAGVYLRTPGMHEEGSLRPTRAGTPLAKDFWLVGMGATLLIDALVQRRHRRA